MHYSAQTEPNEWNNALTMRSEGGAIFSLGCIVPDSVVLV